MKTNLKSLDTLTDLAQKNVDLKRRDVERKTKLVSSQAGSQADLDTALATVVTAQLQAEYATQQRDTTLNQLLGDPNLPLEKYPEYAQAKAVLDNAQRDFDHTIVRAPMSGTATQVDNIQLGRFVAAGTPVLSVIDDQAPWVEADPKETDLTYLRVGQKATLDVDSFPDDHLHRHRRGSEPRHRCAILDPAAAERDRELGEGRAARPGANCLRQERRHETVALRYERERRDRHRPQPAAISVRAGERAKMTAHFASMDPKLRRILITVCTMTATVMQALDTTIANVALPYMQGSLSASLDQINWVLTSYIVAAAIMTAPIGWLADRFGRKMLFIICVGGFTIASFLCALAQNIEQMVLFRLLQGMAGAALVPLSQSVLLDAYSAEERGQAMAIWGVGVMLGPIMGPTLGAWLTDNYSWHWVFLINLPIGVITVLGMMFFMDETKKQAHLRFDWFGFAALAAGIGSLQLLLDRGEQVGWFDANEIWIEAIVAIVGFYYFFAHSLTAKEPFVRFEMFKDRNFVSGCIFMVVIGVVLFGTMALVTPFMQNLLGFPIQTAGFLLGSRGVGTLLTMMVAPRLMRMVQPRYLILCGLLLAGGTLYYMTGFSLDVTKTTIVVTSVIQGIGLGLLFVPISTVAFATLPGHLRTGATAITTLTRNIGSSIGISMVIANLTSKTTEMHARLAEQVTPFNDALQMPDVAANLDVHTDAGRALLDMIVTQQAAMLAYLNDFKLLMILTLAVIPLVLIIGTVPRTPGAKPEHAAID